MDRNGRSGALRGASVAVWRNLRWPVYPSINVQNIIRKTVKARLVSREGDLAEPLKWNYSLLSTHMSRSPPHRSPGVVVTAASAAFQKPQSRELPGNAEQWGGNFNRSEEKSRKGGNARRRLGRSTGQTSLTLKMTLSSRDIENRSWESWREVTCNDV